MYLLIKIQHSLDLFLFLCSLMMCKQSKADMNGYFRRLVHTCSENSLPSIVQSRLKCTLPQSYSSSDYIGTRHCTRGDTLKVLYTRGWGLGGLN